VTDPSSDLSRVPPQDIEAEASLLGSMLLDRECIGQVLQVIPRESADWLYRPDHRLLYATLIDLYDLNKPIDIIVLEDELRRRGQLEEVGGRDYLIDLVNSVPSAANAEHYVGIVRSKGMLRDLIRVTGEIMQTSYDDRQPADEILEGAERLIFDVTEQRVSTQPISIHTFLDETFRQIESDEDLVTGIPTGFTVLNEYTGGFQYGDLIIVAARPSMGKTALGLSMIEAIGIDENDREGFPAVFFSLEMSKMQVAQRMLCSRGRVDMTKLRRGRLGADEIGRLQEAANEMRNKSIFIDDTPAMSVMEVRAKSRRLKMLHDIQIIFVDYLQLMFDRAGRESRQQEIAAISRGLKALGRELNVPVVAMAQLNRQVEGRSSNRPRMSDLRESGAIEQDADVVMLLHREEYYLDKKAQPDKLNEVKGKAELIIDKQRNGPTGVVELHFTPQFTRFDNASPAYLRDEGQYGGEAMPPIDSGGPEDDGLPY
jgi:replicative DNA helicase